MGEVHKSWRMLNKDGTSNLAVPLMRRKPLARDLYHTLLRASWIQFFAIIVISYVAINLIFAGAYFLCGADALRGVARDDQALRFLDTFFFSVQTLATIGYGQITPVTVPAHLLVTVEALFGLLGLALATGLLFARFSRPTARVVFSSVAVINAHEGVPALIMRIANQRFNQIVEAQVHMVLLKSEVTAEGERYRNLYDLELERNYTPVFGMTWTVVHYIGPESPLHQMTHEDLVKADAEIIMSVTGTDETISQTIHARSSYAADEILWNMRFKDILSREGGLLRVEMDKFHEVEPAFKTVPVRL